MIPLPSVRRLALASLAPILALAAAGVTGIGLSARSAVADETAREGSFETARAWFAEKARLYESRPELKDEPGSGWKPYNRLLWDYQASLVDGRPPAPGARWRAFQEMKQRFPDRTAGMRAAWFNLGPENFSGRALAIAFHPVDPNTIYLGTAGGGLWRTTDEGTSWTPIGDDLPVMSVSGVAVSPTNPDIVVIATGELPPGLVDGIAGVGILRSTDGGETFETTSLTDTPIEDDGFHIVEAGPNGTFLAGGNEGLFRSTDDGANWDQVKVGDDYFDVKWKPGSPNTVFCVKGDAGSGNNVKISTDDGATWTKAGTGQPPSFLIGKSKISICEVDPDVIYAAFEDRAGTTFTGLYRSTDGGATWSLRNSSVNVGGGQGWYNLSCAADPNDPDRVFVGGVRLYRSTNGGTNLNQIANNVHVDHHDARYQPGSPNDVWVASDGGIYESVNDGTNWSDRNDGLVTYQFYDICVSQSDPTKMAGGTQDNGTDIRTGSNVWGNGLGGDGMVCIIDPTNPDIIFGETQFGGLSKSTNCGSSWFGIQNGMPAFEGLWVTPVSMDRNDPRHLYTMRNGVVPGTYRTTNGGSNWTLVTSTPGSWISVSPVDGDLVWILSGTAQYTTDDGGTWTGASPFPFPTGGTLRIAAHPTDAPTAFVTFASYLPDRSVLARTTDFGVTWEDVSGDLPRMAVRTIAIDPAEPGNWYIGTDLGVWVSRNEGASWTPWGVGLPNAVVWDLEIQETTRKLVAGTHGRGAWEVDISTISTAAPEIASRPIDLMLDPPAPNPARGSVLLRWASRREGAVRLDVYDVTGRLVSRLAERDGGDGIIRNATWLLDDASAGIYFAVLESAGEKLTRKIVVVE